MKNVFFKFKVYIVILTSLLLALFSISYTNSDYKMIQDSNELLDIIIGKTYQVFGQYGPFLFFLLVASVFIIYEIYTNIQKKK